MSKNKLGLLIFSNIILVAGVVRMSYHILVKLIFQSQGI